MRLSRFPLRAILAGAAAIGAVACNGGSFQSGAEITGLRVLATVKAPPYPTPGITANVDLVYWDGQSPNGVGRDIQICFFDCTNPLGDLYYNCYAQIGQQIAAKLAAGGTMNDFCPPASSASTPDGGASSTDASLGTEGGIDGGTGADGGTPPPQSPSRPHDIAIPSTIITDHGPPMGGAAYGLAYVLFTACAGHLALRSAANSNDLPLACLDDDGNTLGADDFVPGYTSLYVYEDRPNANPIVNDLLFAGSSILNKTGDAIPRVPTCNTGDCEIDFKVDVDRVSAEADPSSPGLNGVPLSEEVWVDFYATRGEFTKDVRLINDSSSGWNDDNATKFKVPGTEGPVHLWAIVHDNRGGVAVSEGDIVVSATGE